MVVEREALGDVLLGRERRGRGHRDDARLADLRDELAEAQVVGPEVMAPRGHAVRLVDRDQRGRDGRDLREDLGVRELLGGEEQEPYVALAGAAEHLGPGALGLGRAEPGGGQADLLERGDLVLLQRQQRRDDDRAPAEQDARDLVGQRLARAGRRHEQHVLAVDERADRLLLARQQLPVAEPLLRRLADRPVRQPRLLPAGRWPVTRRATGVPGDLSRHAGDAPHLRGRAAQAMQVRVAGSASSRAAPIGPPHCSHTP